MYKIVTGKAMTISTIPLLLPSMPHTSSEPEGPNRCVAKEIVYPDK